MQDPEEARQITAHEFGIENELFHSFGRSGKQGSVSCPLIAPDEPANLLGHRERDHEVMSRHTSIKLFFEPLPCLVVLAGRAVAIAAGDDESRGLPARFALEEGRSRGWGAAVDNRDHRLTMFPRDSVTKPRQVLRGIGAENVIDRIHD